MNRRQCLFISLAGSAAAMRIAHAQIPPVESGAEDFAAITYRADPDDPIRSVGARVSRWRDPEAAEEHRQTVIAGAGSDLPQGEFYQSDLVEQPLPEGLANLPAAALTWTTTVGVAAYRTEWALLTARRQDIVWELWVSGGEPAPVLDLAVPLAADLTARDLPAEDDLDALLPTPDQVPDGLSVDLRMSPAGTFDADGTPVPGVTHVMPSVSSGATLSASEGEVEASEARLFAAASPTALVIPRNEEFSDFRVGSLRRFLASSE